jgi:hypothetical protein
MNKAGIDVYFGHFHAMSEFIIENNGLFIFSTQCKGVTTRDKIACIYSDVERIISEQDIHVLYVRYIKL